MSVSNISFQALNKVTHIDGKTGIYDGKIENPSVRFARNSVDNFAKYLDSFNSSAPDIDSILNLCDSDVEISVEQLQNALVQLATYEAPVMDYSHQYTPHAANYRFIDRDALMGAAYEEMGKKTSIPTNQMTEQLQNASDIAWGKGNIKMDAKVLDLNNDQKIDLAEYSASILLQDAMSTDDSCFNMKNINGTLNSQGEAGVLRYAMTNNFDIARATYKNIYKAYGLNSAQQNFLSEENNLI